MCYIVPEDVEYIIKEVTVESIASMTAAIISEEKEREKRKLNLIVHNLPESTSTEASIRKNEDTQNVTSLIKTHGSVSCGPRSRRATP